MGRSMGQFVTRRSLIRISRFQNGFLRWLRFALTKRTEPLILLYPVLSFPVQRGRNIFLPGCTEGIHSRRSSCRVARSRSDLDGATSTRHDYTLKWKLPAITRAFPYLIRFRITPWTKAGVPLSGNPYRDGRYTTRWHRLGQFSDSPSTGIDFRHQSTSHNSAFWDVSLRSRATLCVTMIVSSSRGSLSPRKARSAKAS